MAAHRFSLAGRRALVTGGGRGIGRAIALGLSEAGAAVAVGGRTAEDLKTCATQIREGGGTAAVVRMDVSDADGCRAGVAAAVARLGGLDILVNNAGIEDVRASVDVDEALWNRILDTNLKGSFFVAQAAAKAMRQGAILNLCSLTSERGIATAAPYGASKAGLAGLTRTLAVEWAPLGIRVNALEPGYFRTALTEAFYEDPAWQAAMLERIPMHRFGEVDDLVGAAIFLCSDAARYITGICLPVDGGTLASL